MPSWRDWWKDHQVDYDEASIGDWRISVIEVSDLDAAHHNLSEVVSAAKNGRLARPVKPGTYRQLIHAKRGIVMSDTASEIMDMAPLLWHVGNRAYPRRRYLIHGLGLGILPRGLLKLPETEHIDIVEIDMEVIGLTGVQFFNDPRVTIHHGDALTYRFPRGTSWDYVWHDIWDTISTANLPEMTRLHRRYARRTIEQASWMHREVVRESQRWGR